MSLASNVEVYLRRVNQGPINSIYGKITALISDERRQSVYFQVGSMVFTKTQNDELICPNNSNVIEVPLSRSNVVVPSGWVLQIKVDLQIKIPNEEKPKHLNATLCLDKKTCQIRRPKRTGIEVEVKTTWTPIQEIGEQFRPQLSSPVQVVKTMSGHRECPTVVYTVGQDAMSFIEFIITLRRILADHPSREDILDGHKFLNLCSTLEHPLLAKIRPRQPERWLHVKLQVEEKGKISSTTLVMRGDNLYVLGFFNQNGVLYKLLDHKGKSKSDIPEDYHHESEELPWGVSCPRLLEVVAEEYEAICAEIAEKLTEKKLHSEVAVQAVRVLSSYPNPVDGIHDLSPWVALAGLIAIICESARMNPVCSSIAAGWTNGTRFTMEMVRDNLWEWATMSGNLRTWKRNDYVESHHPISQLQTIYLVFHAKGDGTASGSSGVPPAPLGGVVPTPGESGGGISSSGADSSRHVSPSPSTSCQQGGGGNSGGPGPGPRKQTVNAGDVQGHGRPLVELLAIRANLAVVGTTITVFDGKRGQIVYRKEEQGEQGMFDLVLTGPYTGISAYGCFAIEIDIPAPTASSSSSVKLDSTKLEWEWDCDDPRHAAQVDSMRPALGIISYADGRKVATFTYVAMSDALEATVQLSLRLKDGYGPGGISGKVTARIDGFPNKHKSVLFRRAKGKGQRFSTTNDNSWLLLELARNVVAVPRGRVLHIVVNLKIEADNGKKVELKVPLWFDNGICSTQTDDGNEVEVKVTWYPEIARPSHPLEQIITGQEPHEEKPITAPSSEQIISGTLEIARPSHPLEQIITSKEAHLEKSITALSSEQIISGTLKVKMVSGHLTIVYTIGDELSFTEFIVGLRRILADHPDREDIFDRQHSSILSSTREHPVLAKQRAEQPARWIHVKLQAVKGEELLSTTLIMRDDNLYVCGFMNQQGDSFELNENLDRSAGILPVGEYNPRRLSWGVNYRSLLDTDEGYDATEMLLQRKVCRNFVMDAVHVLSHFPAWVHRLNPRMALAALTVMVCESARMNPVNKYIARQWSEKVYEYNNVQHDVFYYGRTSGELLTWKIKGYDNPCPFSQLQDIYLVLNYRLYHPPYQGMAHGRPRVELLAMRADLGVNGTTVIVLDGKRGQIIYRKEEQEEKGIMVDLVLTGPCTSISAYGCFAIKIDIPAEDAGSSKGDAGGSIKWEWDCYDPEYADEVDKPPVTRTISCSGPGRNVEVTYVVMSDALEATVQVMMRCIDGNSSCSVHGNITAHIGHFKDRIVLFRRTQGTGQRLSPTDSRVLQLSRSVLAVPSGKQLHIEVDLQIETYSNNRGPKPRHFNTVLDFANGISSQRRHEIDGNEVEVNVTWYPDVSRQMRIHQTEINPSQRQPDISYVIGDSGEEFGTFITELRRLVADHPRRKDVLEEHPDPVRSSTRNHPMLPNNGHAVGRSRIRWRLRIEQARWLLHIKLHAGSGVEETPSITLVMRVDTLDIIGFMNQKGHWYDISQKYGQELPEEYESTFLGWGENYHSILGVGSWKEEIMRILNSKSLGKTFAADAVSVLSRFGPTDEVEEGGDNPKLALVGLMVMICESARINPVHDAIVRGWNNGTGLTKQLMDYIDNWSEMSSALLDWKDHVYEGWPRNLQLEKIGIKSPDDALDKVHLVRNDAERLTATTYY